MKRDKQEGPDIGAFLLASVLHFYSGRPLQNLSGVDIAAYNRSICAPQSYALAKQRHDAQHQISPIPL